MRVKDLRLIKQKTKKIETKLFGIWKDREINIKDLRKTRKF